MNFNDLVRKIVIPELYKYNYSIAEEYTGFISFKSPNLEIRYTYDHIRSKDMIVFLKRNSKESITFTLVDYFNFLEDMSGRKIKVKQSTDIEEWIRYTVSLMLFEDSRLIKGELNYLLSIEDFVSEKSKKYHEAKQLKSIEIKCQKAWKEKNYKKLMELLEPVYNKVPKSLRMKYDYAVKRMKP